MKSMLVVLLCIFLINCVAATDLKCYSCFYYEGHPNSDPSCRYSPNESTLKSCGSTSVVGLQYGTNLDSPLYTTNAESKYYNDTYTWEVYTTTNDSKLMCTNYTATMHNKPIIVRGCELRGLTFDVNCTNTAFIALNGDRANETSACFCSKHRCNGQTIYQKPNVTTTTVRPTRITTKMPVNGASSFQFASHLSISVAIYSMLKYVSLEI